MSVTTTPTPSSSNQPPSEYLPNRLAPSEAIHNVYELKTQPELIRYLHAAAGFPTKPTWYKAVKNGQFVSWPGLTAAAVANHFPESEETIKGHARKKRSGLRSTRHKQSCEVNTNNEDNAIDAPATKHREIFMRMYNASKEEELHSIYSDQTGRFPKKSSKGNQYIMVLAHINSGAILVAAMKDRTSGKMKRAYQSLIDRLKTRIIRPKHHVLDNECSDDFKAIIKRNQMTYQLVPPHRESYPNLQSPLCLNPMWSRQGVPTSPLVPASPTSRTHPQSPCQHTPTFGAPMITTPIHLRPSAAGSRLTFIRESTRRGRHTQQVATTSATRTNITDATKSTFLRQRATEFATLYFSNTSTSRCRQLPQTSPYSSPPTN